MSASAAPGSNVSCITQHPPAASVEPMAVFSPAVQNTGSADHMRVASWRPKIWAWIQNCSVGARWPWSIPFGRLVVPELKITSASSSGVTTTSTRSAAPRNASHEGVPTTAMCRSRGRSCCSSAASCANRRAEESILGEEHDDLGPIEHEGELGLRGEGREQDGDAAGQRGAEDGGDRLRSVAHEDPDRARPARGRGRAGRARPGAPRVAGRCRSTGRWRRRGAGRRTRAPRSVRSAPPPPPGTRPS